MLTKNQAISAAPLRTESYNKLSRIRVTSVGVEKTKKKKIKESAETWINEPRSQVVFHLLFHTEFTIKTGAENYR